jgi:membrane-bound lytic murein transglycosylase B
MAKTIRFPNNSVTGSRLHRRALLLGALAATAATAAGPALARGDADFAGFVESLWPSAQAAGVSRETFEAAVRGLAPETAVLAKPREQAEFTISIPAYLAGAVSNSRVSRGRGVASELAGPLRRVESQSGVPAEVMVAILGVESAFGTAAGGADVLRVLATLAWKGQRRETFADEFVDALVMLQKGFVTRERLRGSWAGAMGQPQFMPSAYLKYAQSYRGGEAADIWGSHEDSIASIGNFMKQSGWVAGLPWGVEVRIPQSYDYASYDLDFAQFRALGFERVDGEAMPGGGAASLYLPAGARGPAFLIGDNFEVIRQYNTSDAYALSVGLLADRIAGRNVPQTPWPHVAPLATAQVKEMQRLLTQKGFYKGAVDGKLGRVNRNAVHAWQIAEGVQPADGFATAEVVARLRGR